MIKPRSSTWGFRYRRQKLNMKLRFPWSSLCAAKQTFSVTCSLGLGIHGNDRGNGILPPGQDSEA